MDNVSVAAVLGCSIATVGKWRQRFVTERLDGLVDEDRPGGPRSVSDWDTDDLVRNMRSSYEGSAQSFFPNYYATPAAFQRRSPGTLDAYGRHLRVEGPLTAVFVLLTLAGLTFGRGPLRRATVPFALAAGALMVATVAFLYYDVRYATPVFGFVAASAALGTGALIARRRGEPPVL